MKKLFLMFVLMLASAAVNAQGFTYEDAANGLPVPVGTGGTDPNGGVLGGLNVFTDRTAFEAAAPLATNTEDFEDNNAGGAFQSCVTPVNSASNDNCFTPGQFVDGMDMNTSSAGNAVMLPPAFAGNPDFLMGAITFADTTFLDFSGADVQAVGMDVFAGLGAGDVTLTFRNAGGGTIGSATVMGLGALPDNAFLGVIAVEPIAQIEIEGIGDNGELVDNIAFGPIANLPDPPAVPALQPAGLLILVLVLGAASLLLLARRNTAK